MYNNLRDVEEARRIYMQKQKKERKKLIIAAIAFAVLIILCIVGISVVSRGGHSSFKKIADNIYKNSIDNADYILDKKAAALDECWDKASEYVTEKLDGAFDRYANGKMSYSEVSNIMTAFGQLKSANEYCLTNIADIDSIENGRIELAKAEDHRKEGDLMSALQAYLAVSPKDKVNYEAAITEAKIVESRCQDDIKYTINTYLCKYDIEGARAYINDLSSKIGETELVKSEGARIEEYAKEQSELVPFEGPVEHLFTHCLIAYPELCYSSPSMTASLDEDCITPKEFIGILESLYEKDYILIDINLLIDESDGDLKIGEIKVPKGKTPFVFSVDDVTYDSRKMHTGMVDKLIVDEKGRVCTYTLHADGTEVIAYDNEAFPILDEFVREHPDFTLHGARGTLCHTGFDGVFGYRTQNNPKEDVDPAYEKEQALLVAAALKEEGWTFASHSYAHAQMGDCSDEFIIDDTDTWIAEVTPIIGETKIMVWPFGNFVREGKAHEYMYNAGFRLFCGVGVNPYVAYEPDGYGIFMDRKALDGYSLRNRHDRYLYLFDTEEVWDPLRPKEKTW